MDGYSVEFIDNNKYLEVVCTGEVKGINEMMKYSGLPLQKALESGHKKVFLDETQMTFKLTDFDQHALMNFFLNDFPKSLDIKFTVAYHSKNQDLVDFFQDLSQKVGFDCTFYANKEEAILNLTK